MFIDSTRTQAEIAAPNRRSARLARRLRGLQRQRRISVTKPAIRDRATDAGYGRFRWSYWASSFVGSDGCLLRGLPSGSFFSSLWTEAMSERFSKCAAGRGGRRSVQCLLRLHQPRAAPQRWSLGWPRRRTDSLNRPMSACGWRRWTRPDGVAARRCSARRPFTCGASAAGPCPSPPSRGTRATPRSPLS